MAQEKVSISAEDTSTSFPISPFFHCPPWRLRCSLYCSGRSLSKSINNWATSFLLLGFTASSMNSWIVISGLVAERASISSLVGPFWDLFIAAAWFGSWPHSWATRLKLPHEGLSLSKARQILCKTSSFSSKVFNSLEFSFVTFWAEVTIRTRYHISFYHFVEHCGAFWGLKRRNRSLMNQWKVRPQTIVRNRSQSKSRSHYSGAPYILVDLVKEILFKLFCFHFFQFVLFFMPSKVLLMVTEFIFLSINLFWALLWAHFNPCQLGLKFTLSRDHNMCMPASVNPVVLSPLRRKWRPTVFKSKKGCPLIARYSRQANFVR